MRILRSELRSSTHKSSSTPTGSNPWASPRRAFSLLEVIVAMAIFLMSIVAIGQLITLAGEYALDIDQQGEAALLAQAKVAEVVAGVQPLSAQSDQGFDEAPDYKWSLTADQNSNISNLYTVTVTVTRERGDGTKIQSSLSQLILDPAQRGSSQDTVTISSSGASGGGSTGSPSASSSAQSNAMQQTQTPAGAAGAPKTNTSAGTPKTAPVSTPKTTGLPKTTPTSTPKTTTPTSTPKTTTPVIAPKTTTSKGG